MTPQERLALALQYQKQRDLGSALPSTPAENAARPVQEPEQSWLDKLSEVASGFGYRKAQDLEGLAQAAMHPVDTLHSLAVGVGKAMDNPSAAAQAAWQGIKQSAGEAVSSPYNLGSAVAGMTSFNPRKIATMLESPAVREIVAYHGTPHRFPATEANPLGEFDASKIGTGEGAQVYGHGIYFAENPEVAKEYANVLSADKENAIRRSLAASNAEVKDLEMLKGIKSGEIPWPNNQYGKPVSKEFVDRQIEERSNSVESLNLLKQKLEGLRNVYHADLPDEMIDRMLDWDKPLSEQPEAVRKVLSHLGNTPKELAAHDDALLNALYNNGKAPQMVRDPNGQDIYHKFVRENGPQKASQRLKELGIPGIKYLDAGSRGATGTGTRNFVVFPGEEKKVKILERK